MLQLGTRSKKIRPLVNKCFGHPRDTCGDTESTETPCLCFITLNTTHLTHQKVCHKGQKKNPKNFSVKTYQGRIFLERVPNCNIGLFCFGKLSYLRRYPRSPLESQNSSRRQKFAIPEGRGDSIESRAIYRSNMGQCCN